jgi:TonB family protein
MAAAGNSAMRAEARPEPDPDRGRGGGGGGRPRVPNLRPSQDVLERAIGGGSVDALDGIESGETTALNTKQWKFASFFNRMKRQVAQNWHPEQIWRRHDPNGNVYGFKDRVTLVKVSLDRKGKLAEIVVVRGSGVDVLDEEAVRAFRAAQPFPNPPEGMQDASGLLSFTFGFRFEIGARGGSWRIFRHR